MLAERLAAAGVTTYSLHPATYMDTHMIVSRRITPMSSANDGADAVMQLITKGGIENGAYHSAL